MAFDGDGLAGFFRTAGTRLVAGRDITSVGRSDLVLVFEALPGWHYKKQINACTIDGTSKVFDEESCFADLDKAVRDGRIKQGHHVLMEGVGGGFTWGATGSGCGIRR